MIQKLKTYLDLCQYAVDRARECIHAERFRESEIWLSRAHVCIEWADFYTDAIESMEKLKVKEC